MQADTNKAQTKNGEALADHEDMTFVETFCTTFKVRQIIILTKSL